MKLAAVCIATYRRPEGLTQLLRGLARQSVPVGWRLEVRVVNNDADADLPTLETQVRTAFPGALFITESRRNIAHARNRAIAIGAADAYLFVDDDEVPAAGWLTALLARLEADDVDAVFGPVVGRPAENTSPWLARTGAFDKPGPDHDGPICWRGTRTSSTAVRGEWLGDHGEWFDPDYGVSGGSDVEYFRRIAAAGANFVHERRALVYEDVEADRCTWRAVVRRRYRAGAVYGRMERDRGGLLARVALLRRLAVASAVTLVGIADLPLRGPGRMFHGACRFAVALGAWRGRRPEYRVTRYPATQIKGAVPCASPC